MIEAIDLVRSFGRHPAVRGISFRLDQGGVYGFLGPNGAGKTTTIRMLTACIPPTSGQILVDGIDAARDPVATRRRIGYLPESTPLDVHARVTDYLRFRADLAGVPRRSRAAAIDRAIERCDLAEVRRRPIRHLSKGFRQRVGLAAAILHEPPVLILDEPTVGLDPKQIREVRRLVRDLAGDHTVILSTHILPEAESLCDAVLLFTRGQIIASGSIEELRAGAGTSGVYLVETERDARTALERVPGVARVEPRTSGASMGADRTGPGGGRSSDGLHRVRVVPTKSDEPIPPASTRRPADDATLPDRLVAAVAAAGCGLLEIRRERASLEDLFLGLVGANDGDAAGATGDRDGAGAGAAPTPSAGDLATATEASPAADRPAVTVDTEPAAAGATARRTPGSDAAVTTGGDPTPPTGGSA